MSRRYLRYVLLHKLYVFLAGVAIARKIGRAESWPRLLWRLLVHDWSKFRPSEWRPYARWFYGFGGGSWHEASPTPAKAQHHAAFQRAWLAHIHRNPHHWQHWLLQEDSGRRLLLLPPAAVADEMLADWLGAGIKVLRWPTLAECIGETVSWYMQNREVIQLRGLTRDRIEGNLHALAAEYGLLDLAYQVEQAKRGRVKIEVAR